MNERLYDLAFRIRRIFAGLQPPLLRHARRGFERMTLAPSEIILLVLRSDPEVQSEQNHTTEESSPSVISANPFLDNFLFADNSARIARRG